MTRHGGLGKGLRKQGLEDVKGVEIQTSHGSQQSVITFDTDISQVLSTTRMIFKA